MPLSLAEQSELDDLELKELEAKEARGGTNLSSEQTASGGLAKFLDPKSKPTPYGTVIDVGLEAGIPAVGQALVTPLSPAAQAGVGSSLSVLGNLLGQARRMIFDGQDFSWGQLVQAGATGAVPFAGPAKAGARVMNPILRGAGQVAKSAVQQGAVGVAGEAIKTGIDEGRLPTFDEGAVSFAVPSILGAGATGIGLAGARRSARGRRVAQNAETFGAADITATPGMLNPEEVGSIEQKLARDTREGMAATAIDRTQSEMTTALNDLAPSPREGATIWKDVAPLVGTIPPAEKELSKLSGVAKEADEKMREAFRELRRVRNDTTMEMAKDAVDEAFTKNLASALENARDIAKTRIIGGAKPLDPASARTLQVDHVAKPALAAFEEKSAALYSLIDNDLKGFNAQPILDRAESLTLKAAGPLQKTLQTRIQDVRKMLGNAEMPVSLQDLRNTRDELAKSVTFGELGSQEERLIKDMISEITDQIDSQAVKVFGEKGAANLKEANQFYKETRGLFDQPGVEALFSPQPGDAYMDRLIKGLKDSGINSDEYKQLDNLISKIETVSLEGPAAKGRKGELRRTPEEVAAINEGVAAMRQQANENIRRTILHDATELIGGEARISGEKLVKTLEPMALVDGTMEKLGFGSREAVGELKALFSQYPDAPKMTTEQWSTLLSSPTFQKAKGPGDLRPALEPFLAAADADVKLVRAAELGKVGALGKAQEEYNAAREVLDSVNGDLKAAQTRYDELAGNPLAAAFNSAGLPDGGWSQFSNAFLDPKKTSQGDLRLVVSAWRNGSKAEKATLRDFQARYITDRIAQRAEAASTSGLSQKTDTKGIADFFNPVNPTDAESSLRVARDLLEPDQLKRLEEFAKVAKAVERYEKFGPELTKPGTYNVPVVGQARRVFDVFADWYRNGQYQKIAEAMADPAAFARTERDVGRRLETTSEALRLGGAQGAGRVLSR